MKWQRFRLFPAVAQCALTLIVLASLLGCSPSIPESVSEQPDVTVSETRIPPAIRSEIFQLLAANGLHAADASSTTFTQKLDESDPAGAIYPEVSARIGLDLDSQMGETLRWYSIVLRERGRSEAGTVTANFAVDGQKIVGAGIFVAHYWPGVFALSDHSEISTSPAE